jgi:hypothetical protein
MTQAALEGDDLPNPISRLGLLYGDVLALIDASLMRSPSQHPQSKPLG